MQIALCRTLHSHPPRIFRLSSANFCLPSPSFPAPSPSTRSKLCSAERVTASRNCAISLYKLYNNIALHIVQQEIAIYKCLYEILSNRKKKKKTSRYYFATVITRNNRPCLTYDWESVSMTRQRPYPHRIHVPIKRIKE